MFANVGSRLVARFFGQLAVSVVGGCTPASVDSDVTARVSEGSDPVRGVVGVGCVCVELWFIQT